jgi:hypothetical protein
MLGKFCARREFLFMVGPFLGLIQLFHFNLALNQHILRVTDEFKICHSAFFLPVIYHPAPALHDDLIDDKIQPSSLKP